MPKRKHYEDFWSEFEDTISDTGLISTIPSCVKDLLTAAGYNSAFSLISITEEKLLGVEDYIEKNCRQLIDTFEIYKSRKPFSFLPGHRDLIFGISSELLKLQDNRQPKKSNKHQGKNAHLNEKDLCASLINQLSNYSTSLGFKHKWSNSSISDFEMNGTENASYAKCSVLCAISQCLQFIRFDKHWKVSNMFKHIRTHLKKPIGNKINATKKTTQVDEKKTADESDEHQYVARYVADEENFEQVIEEYILDESGIIGQDDTVIASEPERNT